MDLTTSVAWDVHSSLAQLTQLVPSSDLEVPRPHLWLYPLSCYGRQTPLPTPAALQWPERLAEV